MGHLDNRSRRGALYCESSWTLPDGENSRIPCTRMSGKNLHKRVHENQTPDARKGDVSIKPIAAKSERNAGFLARKDAEDGSYTEDDVGGQGITAGQGKQANRGCPQDGQDIGPQTEQSFGIAGWRDRNLLNAGDQDIKQPNENRASYQSQLGVSLDVRIVGHMSYFVAKLVVTNSKDRGAVENHQTVAPNEDSGLGRITWVGQVDLRLSSAHNKNQCRNEDRAQEERFTPSPAIED